VIQLYKIEPQVFAAWMKILKKVENAKLWLLKFTEQGAQNLVKSAQKFKVGLQQCFVHLNVLLLVRAHMKIPVANTCTRPHPPYALSSSSHAIQQTG
jgi:hypothetical protein